MKTVPTVQSRPLQTRKHLRIPTYPRGVKATCWAIATFANNKTGRAGPP